MLIPFLIGLLTYIVAVFVAYSVGLKETIWFYPIGLLLAIVTNALWLYIISGKLNQSEIMVKSFTWDGMRMLIYAIVPILFLGAPITANKVVACILIGAGMILLNFG